jgi:hypothetical protein
MYIMDGQFELVGTPFKLLGGGEQQVVIGLGTTRLIGRCIDTRRTTAHLL